MLNYKCISLEDLRYHELVCIVSWVSSSTVSYLPAGFCLNISVHLIHLNLMNLIYFIFSVIFVNNFAFGPQVDHHVSIYFSSEQFLSYSIGFIFKNLTYSALFPLVEKSCDRQQSSVHFCHLILLYFTNCIHIFITVMIVVSLIIIFINPLYIVRFVDYQCWHITK